VNDDRLPRSISREHIHESGFPGSDSLLSIGELILRENNRVEYN